MSSYPDCSASRPLIGGPVRVRSGQDGWEKMYLQAFSGISENEPAKLKLHCDLISIADDKSVMQEILFTNVKRVHYRVYMTFGIIIIEMVSRDEDQFLFYADSSVADSIVWYNYCDILHTIPYCAIPEVPHEDFHLQQSTERYTDPRMFNADFIWVVHILMEGIAKNNATLPGMHIITIRSSDATFNIHDLYTRKQLLSWDRGVIKRCGCIESLVFLETGRRCSRGPGLLLWMQHPKSQAMAMQKSLQEFLYFGPKSVTQPRATSQISCNSATSKSYYTESETSSSLPVPHEDHCVDLPTVTLSNMRIQPPPFEYTFSSVPDSWYAGCNSSTSSQVSADSQYSSGYYSENSSLSDPCDYSFLSSSRAPLYPKGTYKHFKSKETKHRGSSSSCSREDDRSTSTAALKYSNSYWYKTSTSSCAQNCFAQSTSALNISDAPPLPVFQPKNKTPLYENQDICKPMPSKSASPQHGGSLQSSPSQPILERMNRSHSNSEANSSLTPTSSIKVRAFQRCAPIIVENLNISAVLPRLWQNGMLTLRDSQIMTIQSIPDVDKASHLICELPKKGDGFFEKFLLCLRESESGTGHADIIKSLTVAFKEVKEANFRI